MERVPEHYVSTKNTEEQEIEKQDKNSKSVEIIWNLGEKAHLSETIIKTAVQELTRLKVRREFSFTPDMSLIAYCIYNSCFIHEVPRTMKEISSLTFIPAKKLWKLATKDDFNLKQCKPTDIIERYATIFDLDYQNIAKMKNILHQIENLTQFQSKSPKSLVAAVILMFLEDKNYATNYGFKDVFGFSPLQMKPLCASINRVMV